MGSSGDRSANSVASALSEASSMASTIGGSPTALLSAAGSLGGHLDVSISKSPFKWGKATEEEELETAATKIQADQRGKLARKKEAGGGRRVGTHAIPTSRSSRIGFDLHTLIGFDLHTLVSILTDWFLRLLVFSARARSQKR